jgi:DNA adenine methylase
MKTKQAEKLVMRSPLNIYGGKARMVHYLMPLIYAANPIRYVEVCAGGAQLTFALRQHKKEVINDINGNLVAFFRVLKTNPDALTRRIIQTPFSVSEFKRAREIFFSTKKHSDIDRAWAAWAACTMGFSHDPKSWGFDHHGKMERKLKNKRDTFQEMAHTYRERLELVSIDNDDMLKVIKRYDSPDTLFFVDPPYFNSDMGFYAGFTEDKFREVLQALSKIKGKFVLTTYPSGVLSTFTHSHKWRKRMIPLTVSVNNKKGNIPKKKIEVITWNFDESNGALSGLNGGLHPAFMIARILEVMFSFGK